MRKFFQMAAIFFILLSTPVQACADHVFLSEYKQTLFNLGSGLGADEANDVLQTADGYVWVASYSGLLRYDCTDFLRFAGGRSGFAAKSATTLYEDRGSRLWVGTNDNGLFVREEGGKFRHIPDLTGGHFNTIRAVTEGRDGTIYFGSASGVGRVTREGLERIPLGDMDTAFVLDLICDGEGGIWGVTRAGEVFVLKDGELRRRITAPELRDHTAQCVIRHSSGRIFVGLSEGGMLSLGADGAARNAEYIPTPGLEGINDLYEDRDGYLWVCADNGLGRFDKELKFRLIEGALLNSSIERIFQDYEGGFWVTSSRQGLLYFTKNKFMDVNFALQLPPAVTNAALAVGGLLYIGTDEGLYLADADFRLHENGLTKELRGKRVRNIIRDSRGRIWISTFSESGLICVSPDGGLKHYRRAEGMPDDKVRLAMELTNGDIVAGTNSGAAIIRGGKVIRVFDGESGLTNLTILSACESNDGTLYLGTDGGGIFSVTRGGVMTNYTKADGLGADVILRMLYDAEEGGIWVSAGNGISFMDRDGKARSFKIPVRVSSGIFDIKNGPHGRLMLIADTGIHLADRKELLAGKEAHWTSFMRREGLGSTVTPNSWNSFDGRGSFYLCSTSGLYAVVPDRIEKNNVRPKLVVNKIIVDGTVYENPKRIDMPGGAKRLTVDLAVLSFTNPGYNVGEYRLEGFEDETNTGNQQDISNISYTNLPGGSYTLIFSGFNGDGVASEKPLEISIIKEKAFYEEPVVIVLFFLSLAALIFLLTRYYYRRRSLKLERRQEELRAILAQAFAAIADTIDAKDPYTSGHSTRVAKYSVALGRKLGFSKEYLDNLYYTALLHDIGKIGIPDSILNKPERLTDEEFEIMKRHVVKGGNILSNITIIDEIKNGAAYHHERYDGTGYSKGLKGEEIPLVARVICVADALDAMATARTYKTACGLEYIISEIEKNSGRQFDPAIAAAMVALLRSGELKIFGEPLNDTKDEDKP